MLLPSGWHDTHYKASLHVGAATGCQHQMLGSKISPLYRKEGGVYRGQGLVATPTGLADHGARVRCNDLKYILLGWVLLSRAFATQ